MSCQFQAQTAPVPALYTEKHVHTVTSQTTRDISLTDS